MLKIVVGLALLFAPQAALAGNNYDERAALAANIAAKVATDSDAWFYLKVCADENVILPLRTLLDANAAVIYRDSDNSDAAVFWRTQYSGLSKTDFPAGSCEKAKTGLLKSVYAPAFK